MALDFLNRGKRYLNDLTIRTQDLDARRGEGLCCFHAADGTPYATPVRGDDLYVVFTVKRL